MINCKRAVVVSAALAFVLASAWRLALAAPGMNSKYLISSPHTPAECLRALDEVNAQGSKTLGKYDWGCMDGDHTGYLTVEAGSETDARSMIPESMRASAKVVKLNKFTPEQIKSFHEKH